MRVCVSQETIRYELIGDYPTQSFFSLDTVTGELTTSSSLLSDSLRASFYRVSQPPTDHSQDFNLPPQAGLIAYGAALF